MTRTSNAGSTTVSTPNDLEIVLTRVVDAPRRLVFAAYTDPAHVPHWMLGPDGWTMPVCEIDLRPGGEWHFRWRKGDGAELEMRGRYLEVVEPERVVNTESWGEEWPETINTLQLSEENGRTTIRQSIRYPSLQARDAAAATGMKSGADISYDRLETYLHH